MPENNKYSSIDVVNFASQEKPFEIKQAVDDIMVDKLADLIATRKEQIAMTMYTNDEDAAETEDNEVENDVETESDEDTETTEPEDDLEIDLSDEELEDLMKEVESLVNDNEEGTE